MVLLPLNFGGVCFQGTTSTMKKALLLVAVALCATVCTTPASAQDLDQAAFNNAMITRSQIKHNTGGALDPLSVRSRYVKRQRALRNSGYRGTRRSRTTRSRTRRSRTTRSRTSRYTKSNRRARGNFRTYRTVRRTSYRARR